MSDDPQGIAFGVGDAVRVRLAGYCGHFHADPVVRIGTITGVVTADLLARDNATAIDPRDILTLADFGDHIYSVGFTGPDALDAEFCAAAEMERLPGWAREHLARQIGR
jgi:hypothetical protein